MMIGTYRIGEVIGEGTTGRVYEAVDLSRKRPVAVKVVESGRKGSGLLRNEFLHLAKLVHPNLVKVYDCGITDKGSFYLIMERIEGVNLRRLVGLPTTQEIYNILVQICRVLQYIHSVGIIHYDVKPDNIIVRNHGSRKVTAVLMDLGLASKKKFRGEIVRGTPLYMAPEIIRNDNVDARADLYSLGVTLYELCTGRPPFSAAGVDSILRKHLEEEAVPPRKIDPEIDRGIEEIILRLMEKEPARRIQSARAVIQEINRIAKKHFRPETNQTKMSYLSRKAFVGRRKEADRIIDLLGRRETTFVLITGNEGVGKSRLLEEIRLLQGYSGMTLLRGTCHDTHDSSYRPIVTILEDALSLAGNDGSTMEDRRGGPSILLSDVAEGKKRSQCRDPLAGKIEWMEDISRFIISLSERRPFLMAIEDLHLADNSTLDLLLYLVRAILQHDGARKRKGLKTIATARLPILRGSHLHDFLAELKGDDCCQEIRVENLSEDEVSQLVETGFGLKGLTPAFNRSLWKATSGNPFLIKELLHSLLKTGMIYPTWEGWHIDENEAGTTTFADLLRKRAKETVEGLSRRELRLLEVMTAIGDSEKEEVIRKVVRMGEDAFEETMESLEKKGLIERTKKDDHLHAYFSHRPIREYLYNQLTERRKRGLHRAIACSIENLSNKEMEDRIENLAYHSIEGRRRNAARYALLAAERATRMFSVEKGLYYLEWLDASAEGLERKNRLKVKEMLGGLHSMLGRYEDAILLYKSCLDILGRNDKDASSRICRKIGMVYEKTGDYEEAIRFLERSLAFLGDHEMTEEALRVWAEIVFIYMRRGEYHKAASICMEKLEEAGEREFEEKASLYNTLGATMRNLGEYEKAIRYHRKGLAIRRKRNDLEGVAVSLNNLGGVYFNLGEFGKASKYWRESKEISDQTGNVYLSTMLLNNIGGLCFKQGRHEEACRFWRESAISSVKIGNKQIRGMALNNIGQYNMDRGNYSEAISFFKKSLRVRRSIGDLQGVASCYINFGTFFNVLGDFEKAGNFASKALALSKELGLQECEANSHDLLCQIAMVRGDLEGAEESLVKSFEIHRGLRDSLAILVCNLQAAELSYRRGDYEEAWKIADGGVATAKDLKSRSCLLEAYLLRGKSTGDLNDMEKALEIAREIEHREHLWAIHFEMGRIQQEKNKVEEAFRYYEKSVKVLRNILSNLKQEKLRRTYLSHPKRREVFKAVTSLREQLVGIPA